MSRTPYSITTDDGREIDAREVLDMAPTRPHVAGECDEGCWVCLTDAALRAEFGGEA